jgi:hypothetical protein
LTPTFSAPSILCRRDRQQRALVEAIFGVGLDRRDEVFVAGAIPAIVGIDETVTINPRSKAIIPAHMFGAPATGMRSCPSPSAAQW